MEAAVTAFDQLKRALDDVSREARRATRSRNNGNGTTNVAVRRNIKIASNVGQSGESTRATSIQEAPITQRGADTVDDSEM